MNTQKSMQFREYIYEIHTKNEIFWPLHLKISSFYIHLKKIELSVCFSVQSYNSP